MSYHLLTKPAIHSFNNNKHVARQECQNDYTRSCRCWAYGEKGEKVIAGMCYWTPFIILFTELIKCLC